MAGWRPTDIALPRSLGRTVEQKHPLIPPRFARSRLGQTRRLTERYLVTTRIGLLLKEMSREFEGGQPTEEMKEQMEAGSRCALRSNVGKASTTSDLCTPSPRYVKATILSRNSSLSMLKILSKYRCRDLRCPINQTGGENCPSFQDVMLALSGLPHNSKRA
jgi:hypothetical protein